jgi:hypothetical protein
MIRLFYRANFCAECGNEQDTRKAWWAHPYLCRDCAHRIGAYKRMLPILAVFVILVIAAIGWRPSSGPEVSAVNTIVHSSLNSTKVEEKEKPVKVQCGARTKKGTPCKHLALPGERCSQHKGQPSMLGGK